MTKPSANTTDYTTDYREPQPGAKIQVIGAGLPRSGTNSFCAAVAYLLNGPAYQCAVQSTFSPESKSVRTWIDVVQKRTAPGRTREDDEAIGKAIRAELDGYVATADSPLCQLVPELMAQYPDAVVVCSTRDRASWARSLYNARKMFNETALRIIYFLVPVLRHFPSLILAQGPLWLDLYGVPADSEDQALVVWDRHHQWLKEVVPPEKLFFVNLKDGWDPLCKALDVLVPENVPFPRLNNAQELESVMRDFAMRGLIRWAMVLGALTAGLAVLWRLR